MKKNIYFIALALATLCACNKDVIAPEEPEAPETGMVFTASLESTKTVITEADKLCWETGDEISINGIVFTATPDAVNPSTATFTKKNAGDPDPEAVDGQFEAYYPASMVQEDGKAVLPAVQVYAGGSLASVNPMYAKSGTTELSFINICGLLELNLSGEGNVASIEVFDAYASMCGEFSVKEDGSVKLEGYSNASQHGVTLQCNPAITLGTEPVSFYIALPSASYSKLGFIVRDDSGKVFKKTLRTGVTAEVGRNTINPITLACTFAVNEETIPGVFSVDREGKCVRFAAGNLYANGSSWCFEPGQNAFGSDFSASHVSHFFWTLSDFGAASSFTGCSSETLDWGDIFCHENGLQDGKWSTLTSGEWNYLLNERTMDYGFYRYTSALEEPVVIDGEECYGIFIYPDNYYGYAIADGDNWNLIANRGIVFLPAAGRRNGTDVSYDGKYGWYWASDSYNGKISYCISFGPDGVSSNRVFGRYMGYSVRLVQEL